MAVNSTDDLADEVAEAYESKGNIGEAIELVRKILPEADLNMAWGMWMAIDYYETKFGGE